MKRIEFIAPVEAMRGNLSRSKQTLLYADNDNPAWDAPEDKRSYARNYQPIFVGAKVAKSGRKYFAIKTKTAITITPAVKLRMALLSVSSEIANVLNRDLRVIDNLQTLYIANHPVGWSFKRWMMNYIREGLSSKRTIAFPNFEQYPAIFIKNPYVSTTQPSSAVDISEYFSNELLVKFWPQLANAPLLFGIDLLTGVAHQGDTFGTMVNSDYNVLDLIETERGGENYITMAGLWLQQADLSAEVVSWEYVKADTPVTATSANFAYRVSEVAPGD